MSKIKELEKILKTDVLIEVNNEITAIKKLMTKQKNNSELQDELVYMEDVKKYYDEVIIHIEKNLLKEEEAIQILEDLEDMRADDDDEV
jgi:predicted glycosyltransferase